MSFTVAIAFLLILGAAAYAALAARLSLLPKEARDLPLAAIFLIVAAWVAGGAIEVLAGTFPVFSFGRTVHFLGAALLPVAMYVSFRRYIGVDTSIHRIAMLAIVPLVTVTLAATNSFHEFMWYLPATNAEGEFLTRPQTWGPWFLYAHVPHSYGVLAAALLVLLSRTMAVARSYRRSILLIIVGSLPPLVAAAAYDLGLGPATLSFVPIAFSLMVPLYAFFVFKRKFTDPAPLAFETVFQNMQDPVVVVDDNGRVISLNRRAESLLAISETAALFTPLNSIICDGQTQVFAALDSGEPRQMMTSTGRFLHVQVSEMQGQRSGKSKGKVLMFRDVSDVEQAQEEVRANERLLRTLIDHSVNGIVRMRWTDTDQPGERQLKSIFANASAARFLMKNREDLIGIDGEELVKIASNAMSKEESESFLNMFRSAVKEGASIDTEICHDAGGVPKWLRMIVEPFSDDIAVTFVDITDGKAKERRMESIAASDPLTGVLNRRGFEREASIRLTESADDATGALLFIDLNKFKVINDNYGHEVGDQLLTIAAQRLRQSLRAGDIIGRPGGDEFVALVPDVTAELAHDLAIRLSSALEAPYLIGETQHRCAASIGLALYPDNSNTLTGLMRAADQAMYRAKARCRGVDAVNTDDLLEKAG